MEIDSFLFYYYILSRDGVTIRRLGLVMGFIELLQKVTTSKDYAITVLYTSEITI
jgi:hypothetical protein